MKPNDNNFDEVKDIFSTHLSKNGLRKTPERFAILESIYNREDHFEFKDRDSFFADCSRF